MTEYFVARSNDGVKGLSGTVVKKISHGYNLVINPNRVVAGNSTRQWAISKLDKLKVYDASRDPAPAIGTRVIGFLRGTNEAYAGYVATQTDFYMSQGRPAIVVNYNYGLENNVHGMICPTWVVLPDDAETALVRHDGKVVDASSLTKDDVNDNALGANGFSGLDKATKDALVTKALEAAKKRGYCDETKNILKDLGFDLPTTKRKVTVTFEVEEEEGHRLRMADIALSETVKGVKMVGLPRRA